MGLIDEIKTVETIINETVKEFNATCEKLSSVKL